MAIPYVELHCHSGFSFLDGASHPDELVQRAKELGYPALALTDHNGLYGSMEFAHAAHRSEIQPITGAEVTLRNCFPGVEEPEGGHHVTLLAEKAASGRGRRTATVLKELGDHPEGGGKMQVLDGRYGPYVKHGKINATLPKGTDPQEVTLEQAVELVAAKAAKGGKKTKAKAKGGGRSKKKASSTETEAAN